MKIAILGTVGVPGRYGGFETLADNLVLYHSASNHGSDLTVWCSTKDNADHPERYESAALRYVSLRANGPQSVLYDAISLYQAVRGGYDQIILLGVSGAIALPLVRLLSNARITTNIDGIEWKRDKWNALAKAYLKFAERLAVKFSHTVVADNRAIADYVEASYDLEAVVIPYGGDHAQSAVPNETAAATLPGEYALGLCRIEPENNVAMILEAFSQLDQPLVFVGNWDSSAYGRKLKAKYGNHPSITIHDPVYEQSALRAIRDRATLYVHGHSAGGTNPALVEMMHFGIPIAAHGCLFNRHTTEDSALYFASTEELRAIVRGLTEQQSGAVGDAMREIARRRYTWSTIGEAYFRLLEA